MKNICFLLFVGLFYCGEAIAQSESAGGSIVVPPSPHPSSLINQIDQSVQLYTGALSLQIPLCKLSSRSLEVPVVLSYNGSGIKVDDISSWVGLGFTLQTGGMITRVMRGLPDEYDGNIWTKTAGSVPAKGWLSPDVRGNSGKDLYDYFSTTTNSNRLNLIEYSNKTGDYVSYSANPKVWDTEPDEFYFNFSSYSGKFIFDKDGNIQIIPHQNLKITKIVSSGLAGTPSKEITSFQVIDEKGNIYTFGNTSVTSLQHLTAVERTVHNSFVQDVLCGRRYLGAIDLFIPNIFCPGDKLYGWSDTAYLMWEGSHESNLVTFTQNYLPFTSTWHITKIQNANLDDFINFAYTNEDIKYMTSHNVDVNQENLDYYSDGDPPVKYYGTLKLYDGYCNTFLDEYGTQVGPTGAATAFRYQPQNVTISTNYSKVSSKKLNEITTAQGNKVKFISTSYRYDLPGAKLLDRLDILDHAGALVKSVRLDYAYTHKGPLDATFQDAFVYWFPYLDASGNTHWWPISEYGVDAQDPTGQTKFSPVWYNEWETMVDADYYRLFLSRITESYGSVSLNTFEFKYDFLEYDGDDQVLPRRLSYKRDRWGYYNVNSVGHTVPKANYTTYWGQLNGSGGYLDPWGILYAHATKNVNLSFRQTVYGDTNGVPIDPDPAGNGADLSPNLLRSQAGALREVIFPTGLKKQFIYGLNKDATGTTRGGLRIEETRDYPDLNQPEYEGIEYTYSNGYVPNTLGLTAFEAWDLDPVDITSFRNRLSLSSSPFNSMPLTKGGSVGYGQVEESRSGLGKTVYKFKNPSNQSVPNSNVGVFHSTNVLCSNCNGMPYPPPNDVDHRRGLLEEVTTFNEAGKQLTYVKNEYEFNPSGYTPVETFALKPGKRYQSGYPLYYAGFYKYSNDFISLKSVLNKTYDQLDPGNESKTIGTTTEYLYQRPGESVTVSDLLARKVTTLLPTGEKIVNETKYPIDYVTTNTPTDVTAKGIHTLKTKKVESVPIETINYLERTEDGVTLKYLLGASLTKFKEFQSGKVYFWESYRLKAGLGNVFTSYPWAAISANVFSWTNGSNFKLSASVDSYDAYGKPLTATSEDGMQSTYTWGYNNSLLTSVTQNSGAFQHQTSYAYKPLVGITQVTDPNLRNAKYTYDSYNRLRLQKDHDDNITARYRYHYKNHADGFVNESISATGCPIPGQSLTFSSFENVEFGETVYDWNFGDGSTASSTTSASHTFSAYGTFTVSVAKRNAEYPDFNTQRQFTIHRPVTNLNGSSSGPTSYDICTLTPPSQSTTLTASFKNGVHASGDGFSVVWEYRFNGGQWYAMTQQQGPLSTTSVGAPQGFGDPTIVGTWEVRCTGEDACGATYSTSFALTNYASNPNCAQY